MNARLQTSAGLGLLLLGLACAGLLRAETPLERCAAIDDDAKRLECFDAVARDRTQSAPPVVTPQAAPPEPAPSAQAPGPAPTSSSPARAQAPRSAPSAEESFGAEQKKRPEPEEIKSVRTHIAGYFDGFTGGTEVPLANGQVWLQMDAARLSIQKRDPEVVIEKGFFGGYRLSVEGFNRSIRVKRIK